MKIHNSMQDINILLIYDLSELVNGVDKPNITYTKIKNTIAPRYNNSIFMYKDEIYIVGGDTVR